LQPKVAPIPAYRERLAVTAVPNKQDNFIRFVYVGGITPVKGVDVLLAAFIQLTQSLPPDLRVELHLYGTGAVELVQKLQNTPGVHYHGKVNNFLLRQQLVTYDVFVFPSRYTNEGHPGVLIEAFMAGLPVIASNLPGIDEIIEDETNGLLVEAGSAQALVEAMRCMVADADFRQRLAAGSAVNANRFDAQVVLPQLAATMGVTLAKASP
jgi:glycosyltransferase involved in cell wall biosynthesis